jgi:mannosyltransferase
LKANERQAPAVSPLWLVPILLVGAGVRLLGLGNQDLWGDEAFSVMTSLEPPSKLLGLLATAEPHPPLYPFVLVVWLRAFGASELVARLPSAFAGIASVAVAATLARSFAPRDDRRAATVAAVVAGLLVVVNPFQVWYSQEARMYAQVSFFAGLATLALLRLWQGRRGATLLYVLAVLGAAGSHYYGLFVPLAHGLALLVAARGDRATLGRWLRATALAALLYLPWVYVASRIFTRYYGGPPGSEDLVQVAISSWARIVAGWSLEWGDAVRFALILSAIAAFGLLAPARSPADRFLRIVLGFWLATPFGAGYLISLVRPLYNERYLIVTSLPFLLLVARGIAWLLSPPLTTGSCLISVGARTWLGRSAGAILLLGALALAYVPLHNVWIGGYLKSAYNTHVTTVDALASDGDAVILDGSSQEPLYRYYARSTLPFYTLPRQTPLDPTATASELAQVARDHRGGWVFWYASPLYDPTNVIGQWLGTHAYLSLDTYFGNTRLQYYRFAPDAALTRAASQIMVANALALTGYAWSSGALGAGDTIAVDLSWRALADRPAQPRVNLRLVDANGFIWGQSDQTVGNGFLAPGDWVPDRSVEDRHGLRIPTGTPPGDYLLLLNVYSADHPGGFSVTGQGATITPGGVQLAAIHVSAPSRRFWPPDLGDDHPMSASFGGLTLLGYAGSDQAKAGASGYLTLVWQATGAAPEVASVRQELLDASGRVAQQRDVPLATDGFPVARWQPADVVREQYRVPIDAGLAAGSYRLAIAPVATSGAAGSAIFLGPLRVEPGPPAVVETPPRQLLQAQLDNRILLTGYDLSSILARPGTTLDLTLHWSDLAPLPADYTVFVHVLNTSEKIVAQRDQPPAGGARPTSSWFPGDTILDPYHLTLPADLPPGDYLIEVGMYNPSNGARLPVSLAGQPAGDRIIVSHVKVAT